MVETKGIEPLSGPCKGPSLPLAYVPIPFWYFYLVKKFGVNFTKLFDDIAYLL